MSTHENPQDHALVQLIAPDGTPAGDTDVGLKPVEIEHRPLVDRHDAVLARRPFRRAAPRKHAEVQGRGSFLNDVPSLAEIPVDEVADFESRDDPVPMAKEIG